MRLTVPERHPCAGRVRNGEIEWTSGQPRQCLNQGRVQGDDGQWYCHVHHGLPTKQAQRQEAKLAREARRTHGLVLAQKERLDAKRENPASRKVSVNLDRLTDLLDELVALRKFLPEEAINQQARSNLESIEHELRKMGT